MASIGERILDIESEMSKTQKNKATAHHLGLLKAKLASQELGGAMIRATKAAMTAR